MCGAADQAEHWLVVYGNKAFAAANVLARPSVGNPVLRPEELKRVSRERLEWQGNLRKLAERKHTIVYFMPQLSKEGAFCIEALFNCIVLQYPGVPLNLLKRMQVIAPAQMNVHMSLLCMCMLFSPTL